MSFSRLPVIAAIVPGNDRQTHGQQHSTSPTNRAMERRKLVIDGAPGIRDNKHRHQQQQQQQQQESRLQHSQALVKSVQQSRGSTVTRRPPPTFDDDSFSHVSAAPSHHTTSIAEAVVPRGHDAYGRNHSTPTNYKAHSNTLPAHDVGLTDTHHRHGTGEGVHGQLLSSDIEHWRRHANGLRAWPSDVSGHATRIMSGLAPLDHSPTRPALAAKLDYLGRRSRRRGGSNVTSSSSKSGYYNDGALSDVTTARLSSAGSRRNLELLGQQMERIERREYELTTALIDIQRQLRLRGLDGVNIPARPPDIDDARKSMTGAEHEAEVYLQCMSKFERLMKESKYDEAVQLAVNSPHGILCTVATIQRFKNCRTSNSSDVISPLLMFFDALVAVDSCPQLDAVLTFDLIEAALIENRLDLISAWLRSQHSDRLTLSESAANAILNHSTTNSRATKLCIQLALNIYAALGCHVPSMICMVRLGQFDRLAEYVQLHGCSVGDVTQVLRACPSLTLSRLVLDIQGNSPAVTLPLGIIVTTLLDAAAEDVAIRILNDVFETRVQQLTGERRPFHRLVFEDDVTSHERWLDVIHVLQRNNQHDCAIDLLVSVTAVFAIKDPRRARQGRPQLYPLVQPETTARRPRRSGSRDSSLPRNDNEEESELSSVDERRSKESDDVTMAPSGVGHTNHTNHVTTYQVESTRNRARRIRARPTVLSVLDDVTDGETSSAEDGSVF